jgi:flagellar L-ring protein precursor FlgH
MSGMLLKMAPIQTAATASARRARLVANLPTQQAWLVLGAATTLLLAVTAADVWAQSGSLYARQPGQGPWRAKETSFIFQEFEPPKEYQLHDIIVVIVDVNTRVLSEGEINRKKKADGSMTLSDWIGLDTWAIRPDPQSAGDPTVSGKMSNKYKAEGELETRESLKLTIACTVVDIRPNGLLVLEGHRSIRVNSEQWIVSLGGIARPEDVLPNNTVLSEKMASVDVIKREAGNVRDGYRRGWVQKWLDKYQLF